VVKKISASDIGEAEAGRRQLAFGIQLLEKGHAAAALRQLAEAQLNFGKETIDERICSTFACGAAYSDLGLKWAARMETFAAAHIALRSMDSFLKTPCRALFLVHRMTWIELELGRIGPFLLWRNFLYGMAGQLKSLRLNAQDLTEDFQRQDYCFACLLLKVPEDEVKDLANLDECLGQMDLDLARVILMYRTGQTAQILSELEGVRGFAGREIDTTIASFKRAPAFSQAAEHLSNEGRSICIFHTQMFGIEFNVRCRNKMATILFAENLLGVLESALALVKWENLAFVVDKVELMIDIDPSGSNPPITKFEHFGCLKEQKLVWRPDMLEWMRTHVQDLRKFLHDLLLRILFCTTVDPFDDLTKEIDAWHEQKSFELAINSAPTSVAFTDIFGQEQYDLNRWIKGAPPQTI
jgi:hypothetical protein